MPLDREAEEESTLISKGPCAECGSSDACATYSDGHTYCFSCEHRTEGEGGELPTGVSRKKAKRPDLLETHPFERGFRGLTLETLRRFGYVEATYSDGERVHVAPFRDADGEVIAQHLRRKNKDDDGFPWVGKKSKTLQLFGQHIWKDGGRMIVVTEGELDAMSVAQIQGLKWPAVSIISGASGAKKDVAQNIEFLERFEQVIFMFDMDEPGQEAALECAKLLSPGKARIAHLPLNDANDMLKAKRAKEVVDAIWNARSWRPDGMVMLSEVREKAATPVKLGLQWWCPTLTLHTYGRRWGEIITLGAGTGVGKTDFLIQQVLHDAVKEQLPVGIFFLEQQPEETARRLAGKLDGKPFHLPQYPLVICEGEVIEDTSAPPLWKTEDLHAALSKIEALPIHAYDHFGVADWDEIESRIRYLHHAHGVRDFFIDHLTALADPSDEKGSLERIMGKLGGLVKELNILVQLVSHLTTPEGTPHEEGGRVKVRHFKGSRSIGFWSHTMVGLERDQQAEDEDVRTTTTVRLLKHRPTGRFLGRTFELTFDVEGGRLLEKQGTLVDQETREDLF